MVRDVRLEDVDCAETALCGQGTLDALGSEMAAAARRSFAYAGAYAGAAGGDVEAEYEVICGDDNTAGAPGITPQERCAPPQRKSVQATQLWRARLAVGRELAVTIIAVLMLTLALALFLNPNLTGREIVAGARDAVAGYFAC